MEGVQKRKIQWAISLLLVMLYFSGLTAQAQYGGGTGEPNDPYLIYTAEQMNEIGLHEEDWDKHFKLMDDIDLAAYTGTDFNIIGGFTGVFGGNGHKISNFSYTPTNRNYMGLFGYVDGENAVIKDLGLIDPNVDAGTGSVVGLLVGENWGGTITNCCAQGGSVLGTDAVGGLVGNNWGIITNCYSSTDVLGANNVGGLVGRNSEGTINNCYSTGSVSGNWNVGGLVGYNPVTITDCYASASVSGDNNVGGLVGSNFFGTITDCYSTGSVTGRRHVGGLVGYIGIGDVMGSFWDIETSLQTTSAGGAGKTTAEMQMESTFIDAGWDFVGESVSGTEDIWSICEGTNYPRLVWQIPAGDFVCPDGITIEDFVFFIEYWRDDNCDLSNDYCQGTDLDFSGTVDEADLEILVENWLESRELVKRCAMHTLPFQMIIVD